MYALGEEEYVETQKHPQIETLSNLQEYFRELVQRSAADLNLSLAEHAEFYIVNLLSKFRRTEDMRPKDETLHNAPLAILLERAVHCEQLAERIQLYRQLGDTALFIAGYFPDRTKRQIVDLDYYVKMGGGAYLSLASIFPEQDTFGDIYTELGSKFSNCVKLVTEIKRASRGKNNEDLLSLYERWLATGCERLKQILQREGIPTKAPTGAQ